MVLGQRIRQLRQARHLTQTQFGQVLNLAESTISLYESNQRSPDYNVLLQIAGYFEVSTDYLLGLTDLRNVIRYKYNASTPTLSEDSLKGGNRQDPVASELMIPPINNQIWYEVEDTASPEAGIFPKDLLLIETDPLDLQVGDRILFQKANKGMHLFRVAQVGDPIILNPLDPKQKVEILTHSSQKRLPLFARVLELRRIYTK